MVPIKSKTHSEICETGGHYVCLYHPKNKIKVLLDNSFPPCNFADLNCEGCWHLVKEVKELTLEEKREKWVQKKYKPKRKLTQEVRKMKLPKYNKDDFERW